jgi:hypothetical protein
VSRSSAKRRTRSLRLVISAQGYIRDAENLGATVGRNFAAVRNIAPVDNRAAKPA